MITIEINKQRESHSVDSRKHFLIRAIQDADAFENVVKEDAFEATVEIPFMDSFTVLFESIVNGLATKMGIEFLKVGWSSNGVMIMGQVRISNIAPNFPAAYFESPLEFHIKPFRVEYTYPQILSLDWVELKEKLHYDIKSKL